MTKYDWRIQIKSELWTCGLKKNKLLKKELLTSELYIRYERKNDELINDDVV